MPIAFPPSQIGPDWIQGDQIVRVVQAFDITNLGCVGVQFDALKLDPGIGRDFEDQGQAVNLRRLGTFYESPEFQARVNPAIQGPVGIPDNAIPQFDWAQSNSALSGVSRDSTGLPLGGCRVVLFSRADLMVAETVSDGSGNFSFGNPGTGPFYLRAYKTGAPDAFGTTANNLMPGPV